MRVQNTIAAVRAFAGEGDFGSGAIELRSPGDQLLDALGASSTSNPRGICIAEAIAGYERVLQMQADFIFVAERGRDSALRVLRVGVADFFLGENQHAACRSEFNGGAKPASSAPMTRKSVSKEAAGIAPKLKYPQLLHSSQPTPSRRLKRPPRGGPVGM